MEIFTNISVLLYLLLFKSPQGQRKLEPLSEVTLVGVFVIIVSSFDNAFESIGFFLLFSSFFFLTTALFLRSLPKGQMYSSRAFSTSRAYTYGPGVINICLIFSTFFTVTHAGFPSEFISNFPHKALKLKFLRT